MKITLELSEAGCKAALKQIRKYQRSIKRKMDKVCKRLAEIEPSAENVFFRYRTRHRI